MGMDLIPHSDEESLHYNWGGWRALGNFLASHNVELNEFSSMNDGDLISAATCEKVACVIRTHDSEYNELFGGCTKKDGGYGLAPALEHAEIWRKSGGMKQH